jgi:hypothetical protein
MQPTAQAVGNERKEEPSPEEPALRPMTLFSNSPADWQRLDWQILRDGGIALYWRQEYLTDDVQWFASQNYDIYEFDCERWRSEEEMYSDIGRVLRFSEWWGPDWDAISTLWTTA